MSVLELDDIVVEYRRRGRGDPAGEPDPGAGHP